MSWILLAEQQATTFKRVRAVLASHGWFLRTVTSRDEALEVALEEPPRLVLVDENLPGAPDLVQAFASRNGGPGVILVGDGQGALAESDETSTADAFLQRSFHSGELVELVRVQLSSSGPSSPALSASAQGRKFTTQEIFGDLLDDLLETDDEEGEPVRDVPVTTAPPTPVAPPEVSPPRAAAPRETTPSPPPAPKSRISSDKDLDDTLAGVLAESDPGLGVPSSRAIESDRGSQEVDDLLTKTLADLDIGDYSDVVARPAVAESPPPAVMPIPPAVESPPPAVVPIPPAAEGERVGEYLLEEKIGVGGMAEVWKARRLGVEGFEKRVAIKKILSDPTDDQAFLDMFIDEAKLAAQLNHNNITHIYELGRSGSDYFIAMEYVDGADLRKILNAARKQDRTVPAGLALLITAKIAAALDYAHRKRDLNENILGLVHRDVSPRNVLISHEGDVKLCDFGVAKAASRVAVTQKGALKGKLPYMSPEQAWGKAIDSRSDIFSAGTLLFEMLTGQRLFDGESELAVLEAVRDCAAGARLDEHPEIPSPVRAVLLKALAKEPDRRYQLAGDLQSEIEELLRRMDSKPGDSQLAAFIQEIQHSEEQVVEDSPPPPALSPLEQLTRPVDPHLASVIRQGHLELPSTAREVSTEEPRASTRWVPWVVIAVFLALALGAIAWWSFRPLRPPAPTDSGLHPRTIGPRSIRPPFETGGAFHATDRSGARQASAAVLGSTDIDPQPNSVVSTVEPITPPAEPIRNSQPFDGDAELQRQFEAELQKVEELLAASPLNESSSEDSAAPTEEVVVPPQPEPAPAPAAAATADAAAETSRQTQPAPDTSEESPTGSTEEAMTVAPVVEPVPATATVGAPATPDSSPLEPVEDATPPEPELRQSADMTAITDQESKSLPPSLTASDIAAPTTSSATPSSEVAKTQPSRLTTAPPEPEPRPSVKTGDLVTPGPGVVPPTPLELVRPLYPPLARRLGIQGEVRMSLLVDETGRVVETRLLEGVKQNVGINEAALAAAAKARFRPATKEGIRVKMWYEMVTRFSQ